MSALGTHPDVATRVQRLQACVQGEFTRLRQPNQQEKLWRRFRGKMLRVAQLLIFADSAAAASKVEKPSYSWPWKKPKTGRAGEREVCGPSEFRRYELVPRFSQRCASGLKCCYPCGTQGCDWICLPSCPRNLP